MTPTKCPKTLFKHCIEKVKRLIETSCINIENNYGKYDSVQCQQQIELFQNYLLSNIPGIILDEVCETTSQIHLLNPRIHDLRIALSVYMHKGMRKFTSPFHYSLPSSLITTTFWQEKIANLQNIVKLDLNRICCDEILEVVGNNCLKLEEIHILSRLQCEQDSFNALKLEFSISDKGLMYLSNCKRLKKIIMNRYLRSVYRGRMMTHAGIRALIKALPNIQFINYENMGAVLSEDMDDVDYLPFTYLSDIDSTSKNIYAINRLCPNLQHLCLKYKYNPNETPEQVLKALTCSNLQISTLELINFPFCQEMLDVLRCKGAKLNSFLHTGTGSSQTTLEVNAIGHFCPSIKHLHLKDVKINESLSLNEEALSFHHNSNKNIFADLECLNLMENDWLLDDILPICLSNALKLKNLTILTHHSISEVIQRIIVLNPFTELRALVILTKGPFCINTASYFSKNCANLTHLQFNHWLFSNYQTFGQMHPCPLDMASNVGRDSIPFDVPFTLNVPLMPLMQGQMPLAIRLA